MNSTIPQVWVMTFVLAASLAVFAAPPRYDGVFRVDGPDGRLTLRLGQNDDGTVAGVMTTGGVTMHLRAAPGTPGIVGTLHGAHGDVYGCQAWFGETTDRLHFNVYPIQLQGRGRPDEADAVVLERVREPKPTAP